MPVISRIWARSALISAGLQPQQGKLEPGRLVSAIGLLIPQCRPGRTTKTPRLQGNLSRRSRSYGHSMGVNTPARKSALAIAFQLDVICGGAPRGTLAPASDLRMHEPRRPYAKDCRPPRCQGPRALVGLAAPGAGVRAPWRPQHPHVHRPE